MILEDRAGRAGIPTACSQGGFTAGVRQALRLRMALAQ
jgi:hypothetical protein